MAPHTYQDPIGFYEWFDDLPYAIQDSILKHLPHMEGEEFYQNGHVFFQIRIPQRSYP